MLKVKLWYLLTNAWVSSLTWHQCGSWHQFIYSVSERWGSGSAKTTVVVQLIVLIAKCKHFPPELRWTKSKSPPECRPGAPQKQSDGTNVRIQRFRFQCYNCYCYYVPMYFLGTLLEYFDAMLLLSHYYLEKIVYFLFYYIYLRALVTSYFSKYV